MLLQALNTKSVLSKYAFLSSCLIIDLFTREGTLSNQPEPNKHEAIEDDVYVLCSRLCEQMN